MNGTETLIRRQRVIDILDRSLPYDDLDGEHFVDSVRYQVAAYRTTEEGSEAVAKENCLLVLLEGEELFSISEGKEVFLSTVFTEGRPYTFENMNVTRADKRILRKTSFDG